MASQAPDPSNPPQGAAGEAQTENTRSERQDTSGVFTQSVGGLEGNEPEAQAATQGPTQNRVCVTCRRRKVKCDKRQPCQNCVKLRTECVFPSKRCAADRQAAADAELLHELRRLEPLFQSLVSKINDDGAAGLSLPPPPPPVETTSQPQPTGTSESPAVSSIIPSPPQLPAASPMVLELPSLHGSPFTTNSLCGSDTVPWSPYGTTVGKLVKDLGKNRYISGLFWDALHMEDDDSLSDSESDVSDDPDNGYQALYDLAPGHSFNGQDSATGSEPQTPHPAQHHRLRAWQLFKENVHPLVALLHLPTVEPMIINVLMSLEDTPPPPHVMPLVFVVYYAAVTSLTPAVALEEFGVEQATLLKRYRSSLQSALSRARLLETDQLLVLQAFVLFLTVLRQHDPSLSWNLTGLAVRLAQSRGIHRDGSCLKLSKFDCEMRRRLWWHICLLDTASSEDHACSPTILEISSFDAELPRNWNDSDLFPEMTEDPPEREGFTDACFSYARCRLTDLWRTVIDKRRPAGADGKSFALMTVTEKENWVKQQQHQLQKDLLQPTMSTQPLHWATEIIVKLLFCNLRLFVYNPLAQNNTPTDEEKSAGFIQAIQALENSYALRTDPRFRQWAWLLSCYHEWFALAVTLSELCAHPLGEHVNRAWRIVEQSVVLRWNSTWDHKRAHQWRSINKAIDKARAARKKACKRRRSPSDAMTKATKIARLASEASKPSPPTAQHGHEQKTQAASTASTVPWNLDMNITGNTFATESDSSRSGGLPPLRDNDSIRLTPGIEAFLEMDMDQNFLDTRSFDEYLHSTILVNPSYHDPG